MKRINYILVIVVLTNFTLAQTGDSSNKHFNAKKFRLGIETGRSPRSISNYTYYGSYSKPYPFHKISLGYNVNVGDNVYFILGLGVAGEQSYNSYTNIYTTAFVYPDTVNSSPVFLSGTKNTNNTGYYKTKTTFATFDIGLQGIYSPFKNEKLKTVFLFNITTKPILYRETKTTLTHYRDSVTQTERFDLINTREDYSTKSKVKIDGPVDFLLNFSPGLLYDQKIIQHHIGLNFSTQLTSVNIKSLQPSGNFVRLFYFVYF